MYKIICEEYFLENVTFIVPAYNDELYIRKCIDSILACKISDFELIIVDDGSTDKTSEICRKYAQNYKQITYIRQENKGVSVARNVGVAAATKDYIIFVDADDQITQFGSEAWSNGKEDVIVFDYYVDNPQAVVSVFTDQEPPLKKKAFIRKYLLTDVFNTVWGKAFNREFVQVNKIEFPVGMKMGEDAVFMGQCFSKASKIQYKKFPFYIYSKNENSVSVKPITSFDDQERLLVFKESFLNTIQFNEANMFKRKAIGNVMSSLRSQTSSFKKFKALMYDLNAHQQLLELLRSDNSYLDIRRLLQTMCLKNNWIVPLYIELKFENWRVGDK